MPVRGRGPKNQDLRSGYAIGLGNAIGFFLGHQVDVGPVPGSSLIELLLWFWEMCCRGMTLQKPRWYILPSHTASGISPGSW